MLICAKTFVDNPVFKPPVPIGLTSLLWYSSFIPCISQLFINKYLAMKKIIALFIGCLAVASTYADPNEKVLKAFEETFSAAKNVKWQDYTDYFSVSFDNAGTFSRINYDLNGNIIGSTRYYVPNQLPLNILTKLKRENAKKELFGVTEVTVGDEMVYFVKLYDTKNWYTLKVDTEGNSEVYEKYRKG